MNRKMLILSGFLSTSLLVANTLQVISCKKRGQKVDNSKEEEKTAEQVELETVAKIKTEIRNAIDEIVTNPTVNDWIINLVDDFTDQYQIIINSLNKAIEDIKLAGENNKIELSQVANLNESLVKTVKSKFISLKERIIEQIERKESQLGVSNFTLELDSEAILPMLTTLTGKQVLEAVNRLKGVKNSGNITYSAILDASTIDSIKK